MSPRRRDRPAVTRATAALVMAAPILVVLAATPAGAQTFSPAPGMSTGGQAAAPPDRVTGTTSGVSHGVIVPKAGVDPGMKVMAPSMPRQSTPVIRPPGPANGGKDVIVPR